MVVEIRDWCQNVGEYNTYNFCIWHFGLCVIVSKIDRCRSSDPPYEIAINPIFRSYRVSDVIIQSFLNRSRWNLVHTMSQPTWWRGGRGLPSLIALLYLCFRTKNFEKDSNYKDTWNKDDDGKVNTDGPRQVVGGDQMGPSGGYITKYVWYTEI